MFGSMLINNVAFISWQYIFVIFFVLISTIFERIVPDEVMIIT